MNTPGKWVLFVTIGSFASGCAHGGGPARRVSAPATPAAEDPVTRTITAADAHLAAGIEQSKAGHLTRAREEFDLALDAYLNAKGGALSEPRLAAAYRRTLEAIQLHEFESLAAGDGFTENLPEPASIDEVAGLSVETAAVSEELRHAAEESARSGDGGLGIEVNEAVLACIDLYQGPLRGWFSEALERGGRYLPRIREVFASEGIPQDLAYVALVESAFKTGALSRAKAKGVWQFIPATGRRFGLQQDWWVDERSNPEKSTRAAAQYLRWLYDAFQDWNLALAAYNAGEGRVARSIDRHGTENFWELAENRALARETRNYVPMIHAAILVAREPEKYGFQVTPEPLLTFDTVPVTGALDLRVVAECANTGVSRIQMLNPELRRLATPAGRTYQVKVPTGSGGSTRECLDAIPAERRVTFRTHVLRKGETLSALARMYGSRPQDIAAANGLATSKRLARGTELIIPVPPPAASAKAASTTPVKTATTTVNPTASRASSQRVRVNYRVKSGDTLTRIAARFNTTVRSLLSWNKGVRASRIEAGDLLTVYAHGGRD
jgi:membrane-bound lytic murein transglycosylase D